MNEEVSDSKRIAAAVMAWAGVERAPHRFGGIEFRLGRRELGHLHGDALHLPRPDSGWVSFRIESPDNVDSAIALFRLAYDRAAAARLRAEPK